MGKLVAAVDVGTGSARAGILNGKGVLLGRAEHPIDLHRPAANHAEYDSEQIWAAVCAAIQDALKASGARRDDVAGISFDATCSLVVRDSRGTPLSLSAGGRRCWDTIAWLDHRALDEAAECSASGHPALDHAGGTLSPEMAIPKLMWLRRHLPASWNDAGYIFDLADFLTWKASGSLNRSQCALACKWTYRAHEPAGWPSDFLSAMGIADLLERGHLPEKASPVGKDVGPLTAGAAAELGLAAHCRVGIGLVDAHAGYLGILGSVAGNGGAIDRHLGLIAGTSSCVMALSREPRRAAGMWGPYYEPMLPDCWLIEGGQSATGALLDHIVRWHSAGGQPNAAMHERICRRITKLRAEEGPDLASRLHVLPDFHGNRTPLADPTAVGVISGLTLDSSFDSLCRLYWRTAVAIALGVRHILETLKALGFEGHTLHIAGGHTKNPLLMELYADATGYTLIEPAAEDAVLLGTGMVAATAAGIYGDLTSACRAMDQGGRERQPDPAACKRLDRDYRIFLAMHEHRRVIDGFH
jgi:FGGY-family pentulose kinase